METVIDKVLEINQKAMQREVPLTFREVSDMAKEYIENASESSHSYLRDRGHSNNRGGSASGQMGGYSGGGHGGNFGGQNRNFGGQWKDNGFKGKMIANWRIL